MLTQMLKITGQVVVWPNTLKRFVGNLPTNCLSVFRHFMGLALKGLSPKWDWRLKG